MTHDTYFQRRSIIDTRQYYEQEYLTLHPSMHVEDSRAKAEALHALLNGKRAARILEVGCGAGLVISQLGRLCQAQPFGADLAFAILKQAKIHSPSLPIIQSQAERLPFSDKSFDICVYADLLEHLLTPSLALREVNRVAHYFLFRVPVGDNLVSRLLEMVGYGFRERQKRKFGHVQFFSRASLIQLLEHHHFKITAQASSIFPFSNIVLLTAEKFIYGLSPDLFQMVWGGNLDAFAQCGNLKYPVESE